MDSRFGNFRVDRAGVRTLFRSGAMRSALMAAAEPIASGASSQARSHLRHGPFDGDDAEPYAAQDKVLSNTAVAVVSPSSERGAVYESRTHVLESYNH